MSRRIKCVYGFGYCICMVTLFAVKLSGIGKSLTILILYHNYHAISNNVRSNSTMMHATYLAINMTFDPIVSSTKKFVIRSHGEDGYVEVTEKDFPHMDENRH